MGGGWDRKASSRPIVRVPRPRWHVIALGLVGLLITAAGVTALWLFMIDETILTTNRGGGAARTLTRVDRLPYALAIAVFPLIGLTMMFTMVRTSLIEVRPDGLVYDNLGGSRRRVYRKVLPWDQVRSCHWNPHRPGSLGVDCVDGLDGSIFIKIPRAYCDQVEAALRQVGKWQG